MKISELATELGYKPAELLELARCKGIKVEDVSSTIDGRLAAAVRAQIPHRAKLPANAVLMEIYSRVVTEEAARAAGKSIGPKDAAPPSRAENVILLASPSYATLSAVAQPAVVAPSKPATLLDYLKTAKPAKVAVDTCTLMMESSIEVFVSQVVPALKAGGYKLLVLEKVIEELTINARSRDLQVCEKAIRGLGILEFLKAEKLSEETANVTDEHADIELHALTARYRSRYAMCVLTQDVNLALDVYALQTAKSARAIKPIMIWQIRDKALCQMPVAEATARGEAQARRASQGRSTPT